MALKNNPFENQLTKRPPDILKKAQKTFEPMNPWDDPTDQSAKNRPNTFRPNEIELCKICLTEHESGKICTTKLEEARPMAAEKAMEQPAKRTEMPAIEEIEPVAPDPLPEKKFKLCKNCTTKLDPDSKKQLCKICLTKISTTKKEPFNISYQGYLPFTCAAFYPDIFKNMDPGKFKLLTYMSFLEWRYGQKTKSIRCSASYLSNGTGISERSVKTYLNELEVEGHLLVMNRDNKYGNTYRVLGTFDYFGGVELCNIYPTKHQSGKICTAVVQNLHSSRAKFAQQLGKICTQDLTSSNLFNSLNTEEIVDKFNQEILEAFDSENADDLKAAVRKFTSGMLTNDSVESRRVASHFWWNQEGSVLEKYAHIVAMQQQIAQD